MDGAQLPQGYGHFEEAVYFLPLSSQKFLVLILSTSEEWKAESTLEPPSGFDHGTPGLRIQRLNHFAILRVHYFQTSSSWMSDRILNTTLPCQNFKTWLKLRFHFWHHSHFITYLTQFPRTKKKTWAFLRSLQNYLVYFSTMAFFHSLTFHTTERKSKIYPWYRPKH